MKPYEDKIINESLRMRGFKKSTNPHDLVWHKDEHNRTITVYECKGWMLQFDNALPIELKEGKQYSIPKNKWHRLVKGDSNLLILIKEDIKSKYRSRFFGGGSSDPDDYSQQYGYDDYYDYDYAEEEDYGYDDYYDDDIDESKIYEDVNIGRTSNNPLYIFDFDDTLALTDSHVRVIRADGKVDRLDSREFAAYRPTQGDELDFSEFTRASGTLIRNTVSEMESAIEQHGIGNVFIVTARAVGGPVSEFLESMGVITPPVVATAGSEGKADWLREKLLTGGYDEVHVYEDCQSNIQMLSNIVDQFNQSSEALGRPKIEYFSTCIVSEAVRVRIKQILFESIPKDQRLYIDNSDIHGKGIFVNYDTPIGTKLGLAQEKTGDGYKITELGKFHNHSYNPSCINKETGNKRYLVTNKNMKAGDEVTVDYTFQSDLEQPKEGWV